MPASRRRRIVQWTAIAVVSPVMLLAWYVAVWLSVSHAEYDGAISGQTTLRLRPLFVPILTYCESELPGSDRLADLWWRLFPRFSPDDIAELRLQMDNSTENGGWGCSYVCLRPDSPIFPDDPTMKHLLESISALTAAPGE